MKNLTLGLVLAVLLAPAVGVAQMGLADGYGAAAGADALRDIREQKLRAQAMRLGNPPRLEGGSGYLTGYTIKVKVQSTRKVHALCTDPWIWDGTGEITCEVRGN